MWRTTKTQMETSARPRISQMSIVMNSPFLGDDSTHFLKVKGGVGVGPLTPTTRILGIQGVGYMLHMIHTR